MQLKCAFLQVGWATLFGLVVVGAWYAERNAMLAGLLGIVWVLSGASDLASSACVATWRMRRRSVSGILPGRSVDALCDCRLVCKGSRLATLFTERVEREDMRSEAPESKQSWRKDEMMKK